MVTLNWYPIMARDANLSASECERFCSHGFGQNSRPIVSIWGDLISDEDAASISDEDATSISDEDVISDEDAANISDENVADICSFMSRDLKFD